MKRASVLSLVAAACLLAFIGVAISWKSGSPTLKCTPTATGLPDDAPLELLAMVDIDCAAAYVAQTGKDGVSVAMDMGYLSMLSDYIPTEQALAVMAAAVADGDRRAFRHDPQVLAQLTAIDSDPLADQVLDFVIPLLAPETLTDGKPSVARLLAIPIWHDAENASLFSNACDGVDCAASQTDCGLGVGLRDKLSLARNEITQRDLVALCPLTLEWVMALRRAGVIDTSCSSTLQVNAALAGSDILAEGCFPEGTQLRDYDALASSDAVAFVRNWLADGRRPPIDDRSMTYIASYFPEASIAIQAMKNME